MVLGGIWRVLFSIRSRRGSVLVLFSSSELYPNSEPVSEPESWCIRKDVLLIRLASRSVMDHGFGCIPVVLFSNGSQVRFLLDLFSTSNLCANSNLYRNLVLHKTVSERIRCLCSQIALDLELVSELSFPENTSNVAVLEPGAVARVTKMTGAAWPSVRK